MIRTFMAEASVAIVSVALAYGSIRLWPIIDWPIVLPWVLIVGFPCLLFVVVRSGGWPNE